MSIRLEQIDELKKRANVSYADAKEALEKCNEDILEALVYLEKNKKTNSEKASSALNNFSAKVNSLIRKGSNIRCIMKKQDRTILNLSLNMVILIGIITFPLIEFIALGLLIALFTGHRFRFEKISGEETKINDTLDKLSNAVDDAKRKLGENRADDTSAVK
ncbi:MAG: DUF4342 domain-containing protein [Caulobacteraceae bacterium]